MIEWIESPHAIDQAITKGVERNGRLSRYGRRGNQFPVMGVVTESRSDLGTVTVQANDGRLFQYVPVVPPYWTGYQGELTPPAPTGGRNLPPLQSQVIVVFIDGSIDNPVVIGSFPNYGDNWQDQTLAIAGKETEKVTFFEQNWKKTFDAVAGDWTLESDPADANQMVIELSKTNKQISVAYGTNLSFVLDTNANTVTLKNSSGTIVLNSDGSIDLNGSTKTFVTWAELNIALATFMTALNLHTHEVSSLGAPTGPPVPSMSLDISSAETTTLKTGG